MIRGLFLPLGYSCNNDYIHCFLPFQDNPPYDKDIKKIRQELEKSSERGVDTVSLTCGEPTIRKDIFELVKYASDLGYHDIQIQTNGRMFSYKKFAKNAVSCELTCVIFSIHGHIPELHDYLTNVKGSFNQAISGLKNLSDLVDNISINIVITSKNYKTLPEITKFLVNRFDICSGIPEDYIRVKKIVKLNPIK